MTVGQAVLWASTDVDPKHENPELTTSEPYVMGSHATGSGAWCSGPEDVSPPEYFWGYNRMTTIEGLFGAGDAVGGTGAEQAFDRRHAVVAPEIFGRGNVLGTRAPRTRAGRVRPHDIRFGRRQLRILVLRIHIGGGP